MFFLFVEHPPCYVVLLPVMQRRSMETRYVEDGISREDSYARELYEMQAADAENYQKLKVKLETDVAILEQQLEHMKVGVLSLLYAYRTLP